MARCEDCIHQECCVRFAGARTLLCGEKADERCKMFKSTADVVPRAIIAEIFGEIEASLYYKLIGGEIHLVIREVDYNEAKKKYTEEKNENG